MIVMIVTACRVGALGTGAYDGDDDHDDVAAIP
jgi:hypothetical protein